MDAQTIIEQLLFSTIRIETELGVGTGFLLQAQLDFGGSFIFLITNKHVIKDAKVIKFFFTEGKEIITIEKNKKKMKIFSKKKDEKQTIDIIPQTGQKYECQLKNEEWFEHPNPDIDLTLINLSPLLNKIHKEKKIFIKTIPLELIPSEEDIKKLDALENIIFIGYPNGVYDTKNLLPIIRRGITATPIYSNYEGKEVFLIDASVFPGSSGSPVFIYDKGGYKDRNGNTFMGGERILFCGVISETLIRNEMGELKFIDIPTKLTPIIKKSELIDLGVVIKSKKVRELLDLFLEDMNKKNKEKSHLP